MWLRKEMAINTTSKPSAVWRFQLNRSICDFIIKSELPSAPFWLFRGAYDILGHTASFIQKIFNLGGNYPVLTHYAGSENSTSFHFQKKSYSDSQSFPTATFYTNRTVYWQQCGVFSALIFSTSLHLRLCVVWHQLLLVYTSCVGLCERGEECRWINKHRPQHLMQALSRSSSDADFLLSSAVQKIAFCFIPAQKPRTQTVSSARSEAKVSWQNSSSALNVNPMQVHGDTRYPFSRLDFITFKHFTFVILWNFF